MRPTAPGPRARREGSTTSSGGADDGSGQGGARELLPALLLAVLTAVLYLPVGGHPFLALDDGDYLTANPVVARGLTADGLAWAFTTGHASNWHPLTWVSHLVDVELFGLARKRHDKFVCSATFRISQLESCLLESRCHVIRVQRRVLTYTMHPLTT